MYFRVLISFSTKKGVKFLRLFSWRIFRDQVGTSWIRFFRLIITSSFLLAIIMLFCWLFGHNFHLSGTRRERYEQAYEHWCLVRFHNYCIQVNRAQGQRGHYNIGPPLCRITITRVTAQGHSHWEIIFKMIFFQCSLIVTLITWILNTFMFRLNVCS